MAVMAVPFLFSLYRTEKKRNNDVNTSSALISLLHWTLSLAWLWQLKAWSPQQDNSVLMVVFQLTLRKLVLFHRYIVVYCPLLSASLYIASSPFQGRKYLSLVIYKAAGGFEAEGCVCKSNKYKPEVSKKPAVFLKNLKNGWFFLSKCAFIFLLKNKSEPTAS